MKPQIVAHRGESFDAPENTLASINMAWQRGDTAVEIDIQLTKDKQIVVIHDHNTKRVSGVSKKIKKSLLSDLKQLDIGSFKSIKYKNERIPTLDEVLQTIPENGKLVIEIKSDTNILEPLKALLAKSPLKKEQIEVIAFDYKVISAAKQQMPHYLMLWLLDLDYFWPSWICFKNIDKIIKKVQKSQLDGVDIWAGKVANKSFITALKNKNMLVYTWTVNDAKQAKTLIHNGINAITTDRANWLTTKLK